MDHKIIRQYNKIYKSQFKHLSNITFLKSA